MKSYESGYELKENEYLLKIKYIVSSNYDYNALDKGFLTKYNKDGSIPKKFNEWSKSDIVIHEEVFREGWRIKNFRIGESQEWAVLQHPLGFTLEVYLTSFVKLIENITIQNGLLIGKFKWEDKKLIQE